MKRTSIAVERGRVSFPEYKGERFHMIPFRKADGLPDGMNRWQATVDAMMDGIDTDRDCYLMIDQSPIKAGASHRRGGVHIEGYWHPDLRCHGGGGGGRHSGGPPGFDWGDLLERLRRERERERQAPPPDRQPVRVEPSPPPKQLPPADWTNCDFVLPEGTLLAADVSACRCYIGEWDGPIGSGGDCSAVSLSGLDWLDCESHRCYAGNVTMLHESLPVRFDGVRSLVRITVPGWTP